MILTVSTRSSNKIQFILAILDEIKDEWEIVTNPDVKQLRYLVT